MAFFKSAEQKDIELEMIEDIKRLDFWITGTYRDYYDISNDTTVYALKVAKRMRSPVTV